MQELHSLLLAHEARLLANLRIKTSSQALHLTTPAASSSSPPISTNSSESLALYVGSTSQKPFSGGSSSTFQSNRGHSNYNYNRGRSFRGRGRGRNASSDRPQCQICLKWGHQASHCYHRFDIRYSGDSSQDSSSHHQALVAEPSIAPHESWFLDSGATTHVTPDLNCLSSSQPYTGTDVVHMGNGTSLKTSNIGSTILSTSGQPLVLTNVLHVPLITKKLLSIQQ
jgi:hypothetical protein